MSPQDPNDPERNASPQNSDYNKPIVLTGHSIIEKIDQRKRSKKPDRKFPYPGKTADQLFEEVISINLNGDPAHVKLKFLNSRIAVSALTHGDDLDLSGKLHDANESRLKTCRKVITSRSLTTQ